jgi:hypothetical protein
LFKWELALEQVRFTINLGYAFHRPRISMSTNGHLSAAPAAKVVPISGLLSNAHHSQSVPVDVAIPQYETLSLHRVHRIMDAEGASEEKCLTVLSYAP